jgi:hypothetical protein
LLTFVKSEYLCGNGGCETIEPTREPSLLQLGNELKGIYSLGGRWSVRFSRDTRRSMKPWSIVESEMLDGVR